MNHKACPCMFWIVQSSPSALRASVSYCTIHPCMYDIVTQEEVARDAAHPSTNFFLCNNPDGVGVCETRGEPSSHGHPHREKVHAFLVCLVSLTSGPFGPGGGETGKRGRLRTFPRRGCPFDSGSPPILRMGGAPESHVHPRRKCW